jgi:hypothetical protein
MVDDNKSGFLGNASAINCARANGIKDELPIRLKGGEDFQFKGFLVRAISSLHSALEGKLWSGWTRTIPANGPARLKIRN